MTNLDRKEADMGYVKDFVSLIAQALVDATELPTKIEAINASMATLNSDLERTKTRNVELDTLLSDTRRQRDEAEQALSGTKAELKQAWDQSNMYANDVEHYKRLHTEASSALEQAKKDRDDYGLKHMAAEDRASEAEAKLKKLREALGMPEPQPEPQPVPVAEPTPPVVPTYSYNTPQASPDPTPSPTPTEPKRYYEGDVGYEASKEKWDPVVARYYSEA